MIYAETPRSVKLINVIETISIRGGGIVNSPIREVRQYWDIKGKLLAEYDCMMPQFDKEEEAK